MEGIKIKIETKDSVKEFNNLDDAINKFGLNITKLDSKLKGFGSSLSQSLSTQKQILQAVNNLSRSFNGLGNSFNQLNQSFKSINDNLSQVNQSINKNTDVQTKNLNVLSKSTQTINNFNASLDKTKTKISNYDKELNTLTKTFKDLGKNSKEAASEAKKFQDQFTKNQNIKKAQDSLRLLKNELGLTERQLKQYGNQAGLTSKQINQVTKENSNLTNSNKKLNNSFMNLEGSLSGIKSIIPALGFGLLAKELIDTAVAVDRIEKGLAAATGSMEKGAEASEFLMAQSKRLGIVYQDQVQAYQQLTAAAKGTNLEGEATKEIFLAVTEASVALQLKSSQVERALYAVQQMISKGNVQSEELRRQLGEQLPGAFGIAAKSMDVNTEELNNMLKRGELIAEDFLPKFAKALRKHYSATLDESTKSLQSNLNRASTAWFEFQKIIMEGAGTSVLNETVRDLTASFDEWMHTNEDIIKQNVDSFFMGLKDTIAATIDVLKTLASAFKNVYGVIEDLLSVVPKEALTVGLIGLISFGIGGKSLLIVEGLASAAVYYQKLAEYAGIIADTKIGSPELGKQFDIQSQIDRLQRQRDNIQKALIDQGLDPANDEIFKNIESSILELQKRLSKQTVRATKETNDQTNQELKKILDDGRQKRLADWAKSLQKEYSEKDKLRAEAEKKSIEKEKRLAAQTLEDQEEIYKKYGILLPAYEAKRIEELKSHIAKMRKLKLSEEEIYRNALNIFDDIYKNDLKEYKKALQEYEKNYKKFLKNIEEETKQPFITDSDITDFDPSEQFKKVSPKIEKVNLELKKEIEENYKEIEKISEDVLYNIIDDWDEGFSDLGDMIVNHFKRALAQMANEQIVMPIITQVLGTETPEGMDFTGTLGKTISDGVSGGLKSIFGDAGSGALAGLSKIVPTLAAVATVPKILSEVTGISLESSSIRDKTYAGGAIGAASAAVMGPIGVLLGSVLGMAIGKLQEETPKISLVAFEPGQQGDLPNLSKEFTFGLFGRGEGEPEELIRDLLDQSLSLIGEGLSVDMKKVFSETGAFRVEELWKGDFEEEFDSLIGKVLTELSDSIFDQLFDAEAAIEAKEMLDMDFLKSMQKDGELLADTFLRITQTLTVIPDSINRMKELMEEGLTDAQAFEQLNEQLQEVYAIVAKSTAGVFAQSLPVGEFKNFTDNIQTNISSSLWQIITKSTDDLLNELITNETFDFIGNFQDVVNDFLSGQADISDVENAMNSTIEAVDKATIQLEDEFNALSAVFQKTYESPEVVRQTLFEQIDSQYIANLIGAKVNDSFKLIEDGDVLTVPDFSGYGQQINETLVFSLQSSLANFAVNQLSEAFTQSILDPLLIKFTSALKEGNFTFESIADLAGEIEGIDFSKTFEAFSKVGTYIAESDAEGLKQVFADYPDVFAQLNSSVRKTKDNIEDVDFDESGQKLKNNLENNINTVYQNVSPDYQILSNNLESGLEGVFGDIKIKEPRTDKTLTTASKGLWRVENQEQLALIHKDEVVVPAKYSDSVRSFLKNTGRSFQEGTSNVSFLQSGVASGSGVIQRTGINTLTNTGTKNNPIFISFSTQGQKIMTDAFLQARQKASISEIRQQDIASARYMDVDKLSRDFITLIGGLDQGSGEMENIIKNFNQSIASFDDMQGTKGLTTYDETIRDINEQFEGSIVSLQYFSNAFNDLFSPGAFDKWWAEAQTTKPDFVENIQELVQKGLEMGVDFSPYERFYQSWGGEQGPITIEKTEIEKAMLTLTELMIIEAKKQFDVQAEDIMFGVRESLGKIPDIEIQRKQIKEKYEKWESNLKNINRYNDEYAAELKAYREEELKALDATTGTTGVTQDLIAMYYDILGMTGELVTLDKTLFDIDNQFQNFDNTLAELGFEAESAERKIVEQKKALAEQRAIDANTMAFNSLINTIGNSVGWIESLDSTMFNLNNQFKNWEDQLKALGKFEDVADAFRLVKDEAIKQAKESRVEPSRQKALEAIGVEIDPLQKVSEYLEKIVQIPKQEQTLDFFENLITYLSDLNNLQTLTDQELKLFDDLTESFIQIKEASEEASNAVYDLYENIKSSFVEGLDDISKTVEDALLKEKASKAGVSTLQYFTQTEGVQAGLPIFNVASFIGDEEKMQQNIDLVLEYFTEIFNNLNNDLQKIKELNISANNLKSKAQSIYAKETTVLEDVPALLSTSIEDIGSFITETSQWIDKASGLRSNVVSFRKSIQSQQKMIQEDIQRQGGEAGYLEFAINKGFSSLAEDVSVETKLERAQELNNLIMERYELEKQAISDVTVSVENLENITKSIEDKILELRYSDFNLTPQAETVESAKQDYAKLLEAAKGGGVEDINDYLNFINIYLQETQDLYKSSLQYQEIWTQVNKDLENLGVDTKETKTTQEIYLSGINASSSKTTEALDKLNGLTSEWLNTLDYAIINQTDSLTTILGPLSNNTNSILKEMEILNANILLASDGVSDIDIRKLSGVTDIATSAGVAASGYQHVGTGTSLSQNDEIPMSINEPLAIKNVDDILTTFPLSGQDPAKLSGIVKDKVKAFGISNINQLVDAYMKHGQYREQKSPEDIKAMFPGFANGGISTSPTLAMVSEGRYQTEAHIPMPDGATVPVTVTQKTNAVDMSETNKLLEAILTQQNITVNVGNEELTSYIRYEADGVRVEADKFGQPGVRLY